MREKSKKSFKKSVDTGETELAHMEAGELTSIIGHWESSRIFINL